MKRTTLLQSVLLGAALSTFGLGANAALIAHYTFDGGTGVNVANPGTFDLTSVGSPALSGGSFLPDGSPANYLQVAGPGGAPDFTVSLWAYTESADQGKFKGLFSNNTGATTTSSWQIDSFNGEYQFRSAVSGSTVINIGAVSTGVWQHIVLQKLSGSTTSLWFNGDNVGAASFNPGGLQNFRVGINRNSNQAFNGVLDNIKIFNDTQQSVSALFAEGPGINAVTRVPAPGSLALFVLGLAGLGAIRRRVSRAD